MIVIVLVPTRFLSRYNISKPLYSSIAKVKSSLGKLLKRKSNSALFSIGILNGFLPCGLVYMALFGAIAMANIQSSMLYMLFFGLGTIPLMTGAAYLGNFFSVNMRQKVQQLIPVFVVLIGMFFIIRGMGLGIPYLSPADTHLMITANPECTP